MIIKKQSSLLFYALLLSTMPYQLCAQLTFANKSSNITIDPTKATMRLGQVGSINGWSEHSITRKYGENDPTQWATPYNAGTILGLAGATEPLHSDLVEHNSNAIVAIRSDLSEIGFGDCALSITADAGLYELPWDLTLSKCTRLFAPYTTCIDGNGQTIKFARDYLASMVIEDDVCVIFKNVVLKDFSDDAIRLQDGAKLIFGEGTVIELADCGDLTRSWTFEGNTAVQGFGNKLNMTGPYYIGLLQGGNLTLQDIYLSNVKDNNIRTIGTSGTIKFKDSTICLDGNFSYTTGALRFEEDVIITGTHIFSLETASSSTIQHKSTLFIDKTTTLNYNPPVAKRNLIEMDDKTARLFLYGATLVSSTTGLQLTKGTLCVEHKNFLKNTGAVSLSEAICFGNGLTSGELTIEILPGAQLDITRGILHYNNTDATN